MENPSYSNVNTEKEYLSNMQKNQILKVKNSLLELEEDLTNFKDRELKERQKSKNWKRDRRTMF